MRTIAMESTQNRLKYWICRITDSDGIVYKGFSIQSAKIAFYRADHSYRVSYNERLPRCPHCDGTGKSPDTFDRLCPHCTDPHCVVCNAKKNLIDVMTFRMCGACEEIERRES